jgi:hypothetical protein
MIGSNRHIEREKREMRIDAITSIKTVQSYSIQIPMRKLPRDISKIIKQVRDSVKKQKSPQNNNTMHIDLYA